MIGRIFTAYLRPTKTYSLTLPFVSNGQIPRIFLCVSNTWIHSTNLTIRVRSTYPTNLTIGRIFTAYFSLKPIFHLATLFARRKAKTRIRQRGWLKLASEKIRREQVGTVPTYLPVRASKFAKWKIGFMNALIRQSYHSRPMDRFDQSFHSYPMDGSDESNYLCPIDRTRPVLISFPHYCGTKFTNRTDGVDSTVSDNHLLSGKTVWDKCKIL